MCVWFFFLNWYIMKYSMTLLRYFVTIILDSGLIRYQKGILNSYEF